jgi:hypothetical protein
LITPGGGYGSRLCALLGRDHTACVITSNARKNSFRECFQGRFGSPAPNAKIILFLFYRNYGLVAKSRLDRRGVRVVTDVERGMRWTRMSRWTSEQTRTAKSCGPGLPVLRSSPQCLDEQRGRRGQTSRSPRRARISRNPSAQGRPVFRLVPVVTAACFSFCRRAMGVG